MRDVNKIFSRVVSNLKQYLCQFQGEYVSKCLIIYCLIEISHDIHANKTIWYLEDFEKLLNFVPNSEIICLNR